MMEQDIEMEEMFKGFENVGIGCGYKCRIGTVAYKKAIQRHQTPFVAFIPLSSGVPQGYLLKIRDYGWNNQLLEPATQEDVIASFIHHTENGEEVGGTVPIVAMAYQHFNKVTKSLEITVTPPSTERLSRNGKVSLISQEKFTSIAFSNPNPAMEFKPVDEESALSISKAQPIYFTPPRKPLAPPSESSTMSKCELDSDDERDNNFIPTPTCAPKAKSAPGTKRELGVGRPRKLNFEECSQKDIEKTVEELIDKLEESPLTRLKRRFSLQFDVVDSATEDDEKTHKPTKVSRIT